MLTAVVSISRDVVWTDPADAPVSGFSLLPLIYDAIVYAYCEVCEILSACGSAGWQRTMPTYHSMQYRYAEEWILGSFEAPK